MTMEALRNVKDETHTQRRNLLEMTQWQCILRDISKFTHLALAHTHPGPFSIHSFSIHRLLEILYSSPKTTKNILFVLSLIGTNASTVRRWLLWGYFHLRSLLCCTRIVSFVYNKQRHLYRSCTSLQPPYIVFSSRFFRSRKRERER